MSNPNKLIQIASIAALAALGVACDDGPPSAALRALHLSPDAPPVDVHVNEDEAPSIANLAFTEGSHYEPVEPGSTTLDVTPSGDGLEGSVLQVSDLQLEAGRNYTALAWDDVSSIKAIAFEDSAAGLPAGHIRVRIVHTANQFDQVDVWNVTNAAQPSPIVEDLDRGEVADPVDIPAGAYDVGIDTNNDGVPEVEFELPALDSGALVNVFAVNDDDGNIFLLAQLPNSDVAIIDPRGPSTFVRVLHLSSNAPPVDIYANGSPDPSFEDIEFGEGNAYTALPVGSYFFDIAPQGTTIGDSVYQTGSLPLGEDSFYSAVAIGVLGGGGDTAFGVLPLVDDVDPTDVGEIRLRIIHAAPAVPQVDIYEVSNPSSPALLFEDADFGDAQETALDLPATAYVVGVDTNDDPGSMELVFDVPALPEGTIANVFAVNDGAAVYLVVHLLDGSTVEIDPR